MEKLAEADEIQGSGLLAILEELSWALWRTTRFCSLAAEIELGPFIPLTLADQGTVEEHIAAPGGSEGLQHGVQSAASERGSTTSCWGYYTGPPTRRGIHRSTRRRPAKQIRASRGRRRSIPARSQRSIPATSGGNRGRRAAIDRERDRERDRSQRRQAAIVTRSGQGGGRAGPGGGVSGEGSSWGEVERRFGAAIDRERERYGGRV